MQREVALAASYTCEHLALRNGAKLIANRNQALNAGTSSGLYALVPTMICFMYMQIFYNNFCILLYKTKTNERSLIKRDNEQRMP